MVKEEKGGWSVWKVINAGVSGGTRRSESWAEARSGGPYHAWPVMARSLEVSDIQWEAIGGCEAVEGEASMYVLKRLLWVRFGNQILERKAKKQGDRRGVYCSQSAPRWSWLCSRWQLRVGWAVWEVRSTLEVFGLSQLLMSSVEMAKAGERQFSWGEMGINCPIKNSPL